MNADEAELWWIDGLQGEDPAPALRLLDATALARVARVVRAEDRLAVATAHALLRARLLQFPAPMPRLDHEASGRPVLLGGLAGLQVSLSHTTSAAACLLTRHVPCGVDVQTMAPLPDMHALAQRVLAAAERAAWADLAESDRQERFYRLWALKEAWSKALGLGLAVPLQDAAFLLATGVEVAFSPDRADAPAAWQFSELAGQGARLAVALRPGVGRRLRLRVHRLRLCDLDAVALR